MNHEDPSRHEQAAEILELRQRLDAVLNGAPVILYSVDREGVLTHAEGRAVTTLGVDSDRLVGHSIFEVYREHPEALDGLRRALTGETSTAPVVVKDRAFDAYHSPLPGPAGRVEGVLGVLVDATERRHAEDALRNTEYFLRRSQEIGELGSYYFDLGTMTWISSQKLDQIFDIDAQYPKTGDGWVALIHPDDRQQMRAYFAFDVEHGKSFEHEYRILRHRDRQLRWVYGRGELEFDEAGKTHKIIGTVQDITSRKMAELELRHREERLKLTLEAARVVAWEATADGQHSEIGPVGEFFGQSAGYRHPTVGDVMDHIHPEDQARVRAALQAAFRGESAYQIEYRVPQADGSVRWLAANGTPVGRAEGQPTRLLGIVRDITQRKHAEQALQRANRQLRLLSDTNQAVVHAQNEIELVTSVCAFAVLVGGYRLAWVGYAEDDPAKTVRVVAHAGFDEGYVAGLHLTWGEDERSRGPAGVAIRTGRPCSIQDVANDPSFAPWRETALERGFASVCALPLRTGPRTLGTLCVYAASRAAFDADEVSMLNELGADLALGISVLRTGQQRELAEAEKTRLQGQLQQAMKMEAMGRLAGGVAHDFNNLLTAIAGNVELVKLDLAPGDARLPYLEEVGKATESAGSLTRQLLAFSRQQLIEPKVLNLNDLVEHLHKMLVRIIGEDVALHTRLDPQLDPVKVDPGQFEQVLVNLAVNARDAMPGGGQMVIETTNVEIGDPYGALHPDLSPGRYVLLAVTDTGHGMPDEVKERLFEPFFTTKPKGRGTGLGLATIFGTVKQAGGSIEVDSEMGHGTRFQIFLPAAGAREEVLPPRQSVPELAQGHETVLLVEDEVSVREFAVAVLRRLGYRVLAACNGADALRQVGQHAEPIDLLMTDVVMPGMNGRELAERLTTSHSQLKVLFTSGYTEDIIDQHGVLEEKLHFIAKPYSLAALATKLREVLDPRAK